MAALRTQDEIAQRRLRTLELAAELGNVSAACRRVGMTRTQFYAYQRRYAQAGLDGLKDRPPIHKTHPQTTPPDVAQQVLALSRAHPAWGCGRLSDELGRAGCAISSPTIQRLLSAAGLGSQQERLGALEAHAAAGTMELSNEQLTEIERANPCFRERHRASSRPGELLCQGVLRVGPFRGLGHVYLHAVVDTYSSYAFGSLQQRASPEAAVALLYRNVLPFYTQRALGVAAVLTDAQRTFCDTATATAHHVAQPYERYLIVSGVRHHLHLDRRVQPNGFIERFLRSVQAEFIAPAVRGQTFYPSVAALQTDFDRWLTRYNTERPHPGYRNWGRPPLDLVNRYLTTRQADA